MKVFIVEDEKPAAQRLVRLLGEIDKSIEVTGFAESVEYATNWLTDHPSPDLIFMDIQLEDGLCFEIFENIRVNVPVVFTTAYDAYSLKAFKVNSVDYLLKPIDISELKSALQKFRTVHGQHANYQGLLSHAGGYQAGNKERFLVKIGEHFRSVQVGDILSFYIRERSNFMVTETGRSYAVDYSLEKIEEMVDTKSFFRVNRNYIVNFRAITDVVAYSSSRLKVVLKNWSEPGDIIVSRERVAEFKAWMDR